MSGLPLSRPPFATSQAQCTLLNGGTLAHRLPSRNYVLLLITMVMGTGSVERFFSFAKYTDVLWFACVHGTPQIHSMHGTPQELTASIQTTPRKKNWPSRGMCLEKI